MTTIDLATLATITGGAHKDPYLEGFKQGFDHASFCPPANSPAGWNCRLAAGTGTAMAYRDRARAR